MSEPPRDSAAAAPSPAAAAPAHPGANPAHPAVRLVGIRKSYARGETGRPVLDALDWELPAGSTAVIEGESGSGKTTLLSLIAGLDDADRGEILVLGRRVDTMNEGERAALRRAEIGIIFQDFHLEHRLPADENVALPLLLGDTSFAAALARARETLARVGLAEFARRPVAELSGGQCQRVAIARALITRPRLLLADEPTANLDEDTARALLATLDDYRREADATLLLISHDPLTRERRDWPRWRCEGGRLRKLSA